MQIYLPILALALGSVSAIDEPHQICADFITVRSGAPQKLQKNRVRRGWLDDEVTTESVTTEVMASEVNTTEEMTNNEEGGSASTEEGRNRVRRDSSDSTESVTTEVMTSEVMTSEVNTTEEMTTNEEGGSASTEEVTTNDPTPAPSTTTEKVTTLEPTTVEPTTVEPTTVEPTTVEPTTVEVTQEVAQEVTTEKDTTEKVTTTEQVTTAEPTTTEMPTTIEPCSLEPTTESVNAEDKAILVILDETGSMQDLGGPYPKHEKKGRDVAIKKMEKFREHLENSVNNGGDDYPITFVTFNKAAKWSKYNSIKDWPRITRKDYNPGYATNLFDTLGCVLSKYKSENPNQSVDVYLISDGIHGLSPKSSPAVYDESTISGMVEDLRDDHWNFHFFGAVSAEHKSAPGSSFVCKTPYTTRNYTTRARTHETSLFSCIKRIIFG